MNGRTALISLSVTLVLGVLAAAVLQPRRAGAAAGGSGAVVAVRPSEVEAIEVRGTAEGTLRLELGADGWTLEWPGRAGESLRWPVESSHVRAAVRLLGEEVRSAEGHEAIDGATRLTLETTGGAWEIELAPARVGGVAPAVVRGPDGDAVAARTESPLHAMFQPEALLAWRTTRAIPTAEAGFSIIEIEAGPRRVELRRRAGRWSIAHPLQLAAENAQVQSMLGALASMRVRELLDPAAFSPDETGIAQPNATVVAHRELPGGGRSVARLLLGSPADAAGETFYAQLEVREHAGGEAHATLGPMLAVIEASQLRAVSPLPEAYASRRSLDAPVADVRSIRLAAAGEDRIYARTLGRWQFRGDDVDRPTAQRLDAVLHLLAAAAASHVLLESPGEASPVATIVAAGGRGESLGEVRVSTTTLDDQSWVVLEGEGVWRLYPAQPLLPLLAWLQNG